MADLPISLFQQMRHGHSPAKIIIDGNNREIALRFHREVYQWNFNVCRKVFYPFPIFTNLRHRPDDPIDMLGKKCLEKLGRYLRYRNWEVLLGEGNTQLLLPRT